MSDFSLIGGQAKQVAIGFDVSTTRGVAVTANASTNTVGSWAEIVSVANNTTGGALTVIITGIPAASTPAEHLVDIAIGDSGSEVVIASKLYFTDSYDANAKTKVDEWSLPIHIPQGVRISARTQSATGSRVCNVHGRLGIGGFKSQSNLARMTTLGEDTASSSGTLVAHGTNAYGTAVSLGTLANPVKGFFLAMGRDPASWTNGQIAVRVGLNATDNEIIFDGYLAKTFGGGEDMGTGVTPFVPVQIPSGEEIMVSVSATANNTDFDFDFIFYGVD